MSNGRSEGREDARRRRRRPPRSPSIAVEQDCELVAAEAGDRVGRPNRRSSRRATSWSTVSPAAWPRLSLTVLKSSRSMNMTPTDGPPRSERMHRVLDAVGEQRAVGEVRDGVVERLVGELVLERLALADVAAVEHDAADVLVLEEVRVLHLELEPRRRRDAGASNRSRGSRSRRRRTPRRRPRGSAPAGAGRTRASSCANSRALHLVDPVAEHALDRRALVGHRPVRVEHGDQVARMRDERAEARLALPPVQVLGERALPRPRARPERRAPRASRRARAGAGVERAEERARASRHGPRAAEAVRSCRSSRSCVPHRLRAVSRPGPAWSTRRASRSQRSSVLERRQLAHRRRTRPQRPRRRP